MFTSDQYESELLRKARRDPKSLNDDEIYYLWRESEPERVNELEISENVYLLIEEQDEWFKENFCVDSSDEDNSLDIATKYHSTCVKGFGYDYDTYVLSVTFPSGDTYKYYDVYPSIWLEMIRAKSPGRFFNQNVRGMYKYGRAA